MACIAGGNRPVRILPYQYRQPSQVRPAAYTAYGADPGFVPYQKRQAVYG